MYFTQFMPTEEQIITSNIYSILSPQRKKSRIKHIFIRIFTILVPLECDTTTTVIVDDLTDQSNTSFTSYSKAVLLISTASAGTGPPAW